MDGSGYSSWKLYSGDDGSLYEPSDEEDSEDLSESDSYGVGNEFLKNPVALQGKVYYQNDGLFAHGSDTEGKRNFDRMKKGLAPLGTDGKPINLHHMDQTDDGPRVELLQTYHQEHYSEIHMNTGGQPSEIDRRDFDKERKDYWKDRERNLREEKK